MPRNSPKIWAFAELMFKKMTYFQFSTWETGAYLSQVYKPIILKVRNTEFETTWYIILQSLQSQQFQSYTVAHFDFTEQKFEAFLAHLYSQISAVMPADIMIILLSAWMSLICQETVR